jgi:hypothetical protein
MLVQTFAHIPNKNELAPRSSRGKWDIQSLRNSPKHQVKYV